jgi:ATP-dependent helicase/nuclease subunit B
MIEIHSYQSLHDKNKFIESLEINNTTLVVSDLSSKLSWQDYFFEKNGYLDGPQVLRAEDLWKTLVLRAMPSLSIVSGAWMTAFLKSWLTKDATTQFGLPYAKTTTALRALNELLPLLCHPESSEIIENWFREQTKTKCHWENWFYLTSALWEELSRKKMILSEWSAAFLLQESGFENYWKRDLVIDLGPEIRTIEVELLQSLSATNQISVLSPSPHWINQYSWISYPYKQFEQRSYKTIPLPKQPAPTCDSQFMRFSSKLAEVKFAIGQVRAWLQAGRLMSEVAVIAPDVEDYWPSLRWHLQKEGIPCNKTESLKIGTQGTVLAWLAYLKYLCGDRLKSSELTLAQFHPINYTAADFNQHKSQWSRRTPTNLKSATVAPDNLGAAEFLTWAHKSWPHASLLDTSILELSKKWLLEAQNLGSLSHRDWIEYFENFLNHQEESMTDTSPSNSLGLYSLMNGIPSEKRYHIYLGCSESQLKSSSGFISGAEVLSLQYHTGHLLAHPDRDFREFQLNMNYGIANQQYFTFAETDFDGTELVPSIFWLNGREASGRPFHQLDPWRPGHWEQVHLAATETLDESLEQKVTVPWQFTLSPATLQSYVMCPFRFFAEKGLHLTDPALVDLDLDARTQGSIQHRLLELLTPEPFDAEVLTQQLPALVLQVLTEHNTMFYSDETKALTQMHLHQFGLRFLHHETEYRQTYPRFYTLAREAWFKKTLEVNKQSIVFRGKIDRIDVSKDRNEAIVIDYKSDTSGKRNSSSWLQNLEFQLPAYLDSVETGMVEVAEKTKMPPTNVVAAHYFSMKDLSRKGFTLAEVSEGLVETPTKQSQITSTAKQALVTEFREILNGTATKILEGDFRAIPHPKTECKKCPWRHICRSPHQNS